MQGYLRSHLMDLIFFVKLDVVARAEALMCLIDDCKGEIRDHWIVNMDVNGILLN